jgi:hypothetical protein
VKKQIRIVKATDGPSADLQSDGVGEQLLEADPQSKWAYDERSMQIDHEAVLAQKLRCLPESHIEASLGLWEAAVKAVGRKDLAGAMKIPASDEEIQVGKRPPGRIRIDGVGECRPLEKNHLYTRVLERGGERHEMPFQCQRLEHGFPMPIQKVVCLLRDKGEGAVFRSSDRETREPLVISDR